MDAIYQQHDIWAAQFRYRLENKPDSRKTRCWHATTLFASLTREKTQVVLLSIYTEMFLFVLIIVNILALGLRIPQYEGNVVFVVGEVFCWTCNVLFTIEIVMKIVAWGLFRKVWCGCLPPFHGPPRRIRMRWWGSAVTAHVA